MLYLCPPPYSRHKHLLGATLCAVVCFALCALHTPSAYAQDNKKGQTTAAQDYALASKLYNEGKNREALDAFNRAIEKESEPIYFCNRAVVLMTLKEYTLAVDDLRACRDTYEMSEEERAYIDAQLQSLSLTEYVLLPNARATAAAIASPQTITSPEEDPTPILPPPAKTSPLRVAGWVSLGVGVGALLGAGAIEISNAEDVSRFRSSCAGQSDLGPDQQQECASLQSMLQTPQRLSRSLFFSGGALSLLGVSLLIFSRPREVETSWQITPEVTAQSASIRYQITF